ncbi:disintegrin and metalloproteinase domain-containing protein 1a-like [Carlito syrichta]|uniref:Disintegrin and metalloproteinase domain-containing protein 1a-like n=1 Tax=Carlito syrichta TaxID=1868482 RepID=A0A1U7TMZ8_CARSF|nr:disintegrin and metalloproteinase domain-containing protein 1a-like [Carlito syrichta]
MSATASVRESTSFLSFLQTFHVALYDDRRVLLPPLGLVPGLSRFKLGAMLILGMIFLPSIYSDMSSVQYPSYEIVIPKSLTVRENEDPVEKASYMLFLHGQKHLVHLQLKRDYFVSHFPVYIYHSGILGQDVPLISRDCHYEGYIEGVPGSFVSVNTCAGLRGILSKEGTSYGIEPMDSSKQSVESFHQEDVLLSAALMVHELGHNLGIQHDHSACFCKDKPFCLMHENFTKESRFSNCSSHYFHRFLQEHKGACLFNKPWHKGRKRRDSRCGNGVVEDTEQCDCGSACHLDPCCLRTCNLTKNATCNQGLCCFNCLFRRKGFVCRPPQDECDLPEYCNGSFATCPTDSYKQDGTECQKRNYCFGGRCRSRKNQCAAVFGSNARDAPDKCYTSLNRKPNRFGNCGFVTSRQIGYIKCQKGDVRCGKLICTDVSNLPEIKPHHTITQVSIDDIFCWSMDAFHVTDIPDDGDVVTGTSCAPRKVCMNYSCTDHTVFHYDCVPEQMCNGKGICNNLKHCHCDAGFAPPNCTKPGYGGSVDSGFAYNEVKKLAMHMEHQSPPVPPILLSLILLALILCLIIIILKNPRGAPAETLAEAPAEALAETPVDAMAAAPLEKLTE